MEDYRSNSFVSRREEADITPQRHEKIISGSAKKHKKSEISKIINAFMPDTDDIGDYILTEVLVPKVKAILADTVNSLLGFDVVRQKERQPYSKVSYRKYLDNDRRESDWGRDRSEKSRNSLPRSVRNYQDVIVASREDGEEVLSILEDTIDEFGYASIGDLYDLVGIPADHTTYNYGWNRPQMRQARITRLRDGDYLIEMPKFRPIERR